jgi:hypothetical protein
MANGGLIFPNVMTTCNCSACKPGAYTLTTYGGGAGGGGGSCLSTTTVTAGSSGSGSGWYTTVYSPHTQPVTTTTTTITIDAVPARVPRFVRMGGLIHAHWEYGTYYSGPGYSGYSGYLNSGGSHTGYSNNVTLCGQSVPFDMPWRYVRSQYPDLENLDNASERDVTCIACICAKK